MFIFVNTKFSKRKIFVCFVEFILKKPSIFTSVLVEFFKKEMWEKEKRAIEIAFLGQSRHNVSEEERISETGK